MLSNNQPQRTSKAGQVFSKMYDEQRRDLIRLLYKTPAFVEMVSKLQGSVSGEGYRIVIPPDLLQQLKDHTARFGNSASGGFSANIHNSKSGDFIGQISLEQASPELISSLNQMATQKVLADIAQRLELIEQKIDEVLQGQRDDRNGLLDSGENLYALASIAMDTKNRRLLLTSAVAQLSEARGRLMRDLETSIKSIHEIPDDKWGIILKSLWRNIPKDVERRAELLENALKDVLRASCVLALSCGQLNEPLLLQEAWRPLENFLPQVRVAQKKIIHWLPSNPYALPDKFSTLLAITDGIIQTGKQLESGQRGTLEIEFSPTDMIDGENL